MNVKSLFISIFNPSNFAYQINIYFVRLNNFAFIVLLLHLYYYCISIGVETQFLNVVESGAYNLIKIPYTLMIHFDYIEAHSHKHFIIIIMDMQSFNSIFRL